MKTTLVFCIITVLFSGIHAYTTQGNKLLDPNGTQVILRGVDRCSMEWVSVGEQLSLSDYTLMKGWGSNVVRLALCQDYLLVSSSSYDPNYDDLIKQQVDWVTSLGMGIILDLHWNNGGQQKMADLNSITFWSTIASKYKNNPWVIFELYNEPHDVSWDVWLKGDSEWTGMAQLYTAVRNAGAQNLVIINGLNWAYDLSNVTNNLIPGATNFIFGTHPYDYDGKQKGDWPGGFGYLASTYNVMMTEFGQYCNSDTYVQDLLAYAQSLNLHWSAWAWYVSGCAFPSIINDWDGTPTVPVGTIVQQYLQGNGSIITSGASLSSSTGPVMPATQPLVVYDDSLKNGFQDWSWSTNYSLSGTSFVHQGSNAISFDVKAYEALYFHTPNYFTLSEYGSLQLYINGGNNTVPGGQIVVIIYDQTATTTGSAVVTQTVLPKTWTLISFPVSSFGASLTTTISGIAIQGDISGNSGIVWIDDISFLPPQPVLTTGTGTGSPSAPTLSTSSVTTSTIATGSAPILSSFGWLIMVVPIFSVFCGL